MTNKTARLIILREKSKLCDASEMLLTFKAVDKVLVYDHSNEQYFRVELFIMLYKWSETLMYGHPNESY